LKQSFFFFSGRDAGIDVNSRENGGTYYEKDDQ
jgi:hypothetical protein